MSFRGGYIWQTTAGTETLQKRVCDVTTGKEGSTMSWTQWEVACRIYVCGKGRI